MIVSLTIVHFFTIKTRRGGIRNFLPIFKVDVRFLTKIFRHGRGQWSVWNFFFCPEMVQFRGTNFLSCDQKIRGSRKSTFPLCILSCEASNGIYLPSVMNQSQEMIFYWNQDLHPQPLPSLKNLGWNKKSPRD